MHLTRLAELIQQQDFNENAFQATRNIKIVKTTSLVGFRFSLRRKNEIAKHDRRDQALVSAITLL